MEISHRPRPLSLLSTKQVARENAQRDVVRHGDARAATNEASSVAEIEHFVQTTDEMSAAMAQFRLRRDYEKKSDSLSGSFERVLDDEVLPKAQQILQIAKGHHLTPEALLSQARALFPDDSDLVLVLRELLRQRKMEEVVTQRLQSLLQQIEDQAEPKSLKAGINCALKARLFGHTLELSPGLLRASYRQFLQSEQPEIEVYADWIGSYGHQRRAPVLDFIESALLVDINAQDPSCSRLEFGGLLGRLSQLKLLRSADKVFVNRLQTNPVAQAFNTYEESWLLLMLALLQQPHGLDRILAETLGSSALLSRHSEHSSLLHVLYLACHALPPPLFLEGDGHEVVLDTLRNMATMAYQHEREERHLKAEESPLHRINQDD